MTLWPWTGSKDMDVNLASGIAGGTAVDRPRAQRMPDGWRLPDAVIFDLDGVLVDSEPFWQRAFADVANAWCRDHGLVDPGLTAADMAEFQGGRVNDTMRKVIKRQLNDQQSEQRLSAAEVALLTEQVIDHVIAEFSTEPTPISSTVEVATRLAAAGIPLAVASSSSSRFIDAALDTLGLADVIAVRHSALELKHGKPAPEVYELALRELGVSAEAAVAVEDSLTGLVSALRADLKALWLAPTRASESELMAELVARLDEVAAPRSLADRAQVIGRLSVSDFGIEDVPA